MSRLITPSLISSVNWLQTCPASWKAKAVKDLKNQLARVYSELSPAQELGIKFEDAVMKATKLDEPKGSEHFKWMVAEVKGGDFQRPTITELSIDGHDYCLYGRIDAYFRDIIKDIKTTSNWKGNDYYLNSYQHRIYCYNEKIPFFRYCIAIFDSSQNIIDHHAVDVELDLISLEADIVNKIKEVIAFLSVNTELFDLYISTFCRR